MNEERKITINYQGKEVRDKQVRLRKYKSGKSEYTIYNKKIVVVLHNNGAKNIQEDRAKDKKTGK